MEQSNLQQKKLNIIQLIVAVAAACLVHGVMPVSYTHLDVYKRQGGERT